MSTQFDLFLSEDRLQNIRSKAARIAARMCGNCPCSSSVELDSNSCCQLEIVLADYIRLAEATRNLIAHVSTECRSDGEAMESAAVCTWALDELEYIETLELKVTNEKVYGRG